MPGNPHWWLFFCSVFLEIVWKSLKRHNNGYIWKTFTSKIQFQCIFHLFWLFWHYVTPWKLVKSCKRSSNAHLHHSYFISIELHQNKLKYIASYHLLGLVCHQVVFCIFLNKWQISSQNLGLRIPPRWHFWSNLWLETLINGCFLFTNSWNT